MIKHLRQALLVASLLAGQMSAGASEHGAQVHIDNFSFSPASITIPRGTTVTWTNRDDIPHTVVSTNGKSFKSHPLDSDDTYSFTFETAGQYGYFCSLHPHMQGTVIVQ